MDVIATDGGLLAEPVTKPYIMLAPGQRIEVWADFKNLPVGSRIRLVSMEFQGAGLGGGVVQQGAPFDVMEFRIDRKEPETLSLPSKLAPFPRHDISSAINRKDPRTLPISGQGQLWLLNGAPFEMEYVAKNEIVRLNTLETWLYTNTAAGTKMAHPIHAHGPQVQVYRRTIDPLFAPNYETVRHGIVDEGIVDTMLLMPGETVQTLVKFDTYTGMYLYHCHNLEHEDHGMMRNFRIDPS
jgi:FtsP/CotA-like multicopper oxidase with cupredoxin domain